MWGDGGPLAAFVVGVGAVVGPGIAACYKFRLDSFSRLVCYFYMSRILDFGLCVTGCHERLVWCSF